ncbi:MAG TPA: hypothetical protein VHY31_19070 [Streptosporangiaceae bacterium]|nr:hypothetical protein [Streptosporangiaceae bacterium]
MARVWLCGTNALTLGAFAVAVALGPPASAPPARALAWLLFVGSSVHVASTGWLYTLPEVRRHAREHAGRLIWLPVALIIGAAAVAAAVSPSVMAWCLLPYYTWQFFHFQKQNLGLAALAASSGRAASGRAARGRAGPALRPAERRAIMAAGYAGIAGLITHPGLLQLGINTRLTWLYPVAVTAFAVAVAAGLGCVAQRLARGAAFSFGVIFLTSLGFFLPVFVLRSPYAAVGGMTIAHGLQYLLLVTLVAVGRRPEARQSETGRAVAGRAVTLALLANVALVGGVVLSAASHLHGAAWAGRLAFGAYLGAVMAHFVIDASVWRLRDPFPRAFLAARVPGLLPAGNRGGSPGPYRSSADIG